MLDRVRFALRLRHYSRRTEDAYVAWIRRYILFHGKRHPADMGATELTAFLSSLAVDRRVATSTQNQALSALLFLYRDVLELDVPWLDDRVRAKRPLRLPVVLTREEVRMVLQRLNGVPRLMASLLYGSGLRLLECCRLRVQDVDLATHQIIVRAAKGDKDRVTVLPAVIGPRAASRSGSRATPASDRAGPKVPERRAGVGMAVAGAWIRAGGVGGAARWRGPGRAASRGRHVLNRGPSAVRSPVDTLLGG